MIGRDVRATIRLAMENITRWRRQETADTVLTARKNGLTVREAALAAGCSLRHAKRILAAHDVKLGCLRPNLPQPPAPPPCYAQAHAAHLAAGQTECWPEAPAAPTVASPPPPMESPKRESLGGLHDYEDYQAQRRLEDIARRRTVTEPAPEAAEPTHAEVRRQVLTIRSGDDPVTAVAKAMQTAPAGLIVSAVETPIDEGGWFKVTAARARQMDAYTVSNGMVGTEYQTVRAGADGRPVAAEGWRFPSLSNLRLK